MSKATLRVLRAELDAALAPVAARNNITITTGSCSFMGGTATFKVEVATVSADGVVASREADDFKRHAIMFGVKPEDMHRELTHGGRVYTLTGLAVKSTKFPFLAKSKLDGKIYKLPADDVRVALGYKANRFE
jgi:hypothetical protein